MGSCSDGAWDTAQLLRWVCSTLWHALLADGLHVCCSPEDNTGVLMPPACTLFLSKQTQRLLAVQQAPVHHHSCLAACRVLSSFRQASCPPAWPTPTHT